MNKGQTGFIFLLVLAIIMIVIGIQGNLGLTFAILFCPTRVDLIE